LTKTTTISLNRIKGILRSRTRILKSYWEYGNMYFKKYKTPKILFIWIPKNAGTSIFHSFKESLGMEKYIHIDEAKKSFINQGAVTFGHISLKILFEHNIIKPQFYRKAKIFCVSRNPYDRLVSLLHYHKKHDLIPKHYTSLNLLEDILKGIPKIGSYNSQGLSLCNTQISWIKNVRVDEIIQFEQLNNTHPFLNKYLKKGMMIEHKNKSKNRQEYLNELDNESIALINKYYRDDFDFFGYEMITSIC